MEVEALLIVKPSLIASFSEQQTNEQASTYDDLHGQYHSIIHHDIIHLLGLSKTLFPANYVCLGGYIDPGSNLQSDTLYVASCFLIHYRETLFAEC